MESHFFFLTSILTICFFLTTLPKSLCQQNQNLACQYSFNCGKLENISYPFWSENLRPPDCRSDGFELNCQEDQFPSIQVGSQTFEVLNINPLNYTMKIRRTGLVYDNCSSDFTNTSLNTQYNLFRYRSNVKNVTLFYACPSEFSIGRNNFSCQTQTSELVYYVEDDHPLSQSPDFHKCGRRKNVPILRNFTLGPEHALEDLKRALEYGFDVIYAADGGFSCIECVNSGGRCGINGTDDNSSFICHCRDGTYPTNCQPDSEWDCRRPFNCGKLENISYPFWSENLQPRYCGSEGFELNCREGHVASILVGTHNFEVLNIYPFTNTMTIRRTQLFNYDYCSSDFTSTSLNTQYNLFRYRSNVKIVTLFYDCPSEVSISRNYFTCQTQTNELVYYVEDDDPLSKSPEFNKCERPIKVPILRNFTLEPDNPVEDLKRALDHGFDVIYVADGWASCIKCLKSGGRCGINGTDDNSPFICHCRDGDHLTHCPDSHPIRSNRGNSCITCENSGGRCEAYGTDDYFPFICRCRDGAYLTDCPDSKKWHRKVIVGFMCGAAGALLICMTIWCCIMNSLIQKKTKLPNTTRVDKDIEAFIRNHGLLALTRYKFSAVKKMTKSFQVKLGQGGYGVVYKGELLSGHPVAVKVLTASKGSGEEFINEVASISKTSHVNVVTLLGFCLEGRKKALIYEFMPNGSLEKFICNKADETTLSLTSEKLHQIAIGIASGLEYLHRGCNTRILHFDIKPHNILLDENFCPKISDFGLAKLCPRKESIISLSEARGTIGYLAPEVWNRNIGGVSHKSDVYSYGMMLLDMVGGRNNMNAKANDSSEIYFPDWIYNKLEEGGDLGHDGAITAEENDIAKRMTMVALWCIQTLPTHRPTISRVIEMLEGSLDSLEMPPKPVMSSPTRSAAKSSTTTS